MGSSVQVLPKTVRHNTVPGWDRGFPTVLDFIYIYDGVRPWVRIVSSKSDD